jgi:hypothetical protein
MTLLEDKFRITQGGKSYISCCDWAIRLSANCRPYPRAWPTGCNEYWHIHIHIQCTHVVGLSECHERQSHKSRVWIGRVTIIVHDPAAGVTKHLLSWCVMPSIICSFRIRLESVTYVTRIPCMQCVPIVAAGSIRSWNQFSDRQKRGRQSDYGNGNETANFAINNQLWVE